MSDPQWKGLNFADNDAFKGTIGFLEDVRDTLNPVISVLEAIQALLDLVSDFLIAVDGAIEAIIRTIVKQIKELISDLLNNNIAMCFHTNLKWDDNWTFAPQETLTTAAQSNTGLPVFNRNFTVDNDLPWRGTGMQGWLAEILFSSYDDSNTERPLTDSDTPVFGFLFAVGVPSFSEFQDLLPSILQVGRDWSIPGIDKWKDQTAEWFESEYGKTTEKLKDMTFDNYDPLNPKNNFGDFKGFKTELVQQFTKGDLNPFSGNLDEVLSGMPHWQRIAIADLFGPEMKAFFKFLDDLADALIGLSDLTPLAKLLKTLSKKIERVVALLEQIQDIIDAIILLLKALSNGKYIALNVEEGGMKALIQKAASAKNIVDVGADGIVAGFVAIATADDGMDQIDKMLELVGAQADKITDQFEDFEESFTEHTEEINNTLNGSSWTVTWASQEPSYDQ